MKRYANQSGDSGVMAYENGADFIIVQFKGGKTYLYNYLSAGATTIELMKQLAIDGQGLSTFISQEAWNKYASRL